MYRFPRLPRPSFARMPAACTIVVVVLGCEGSTVAPVEEPEPQPPARLAFLTQPRGAVAGAAINPAVRVAVLDSAGNLASDAAIPVSISLDGNPGGAGLLGELTVLSAAGIAEFDALALDRTGSGYTLAASATGLGGATSEPFGIEPAAAARLAIVSQPDTVEGLVAFGSPIEVEIQDEFGNHIPAATTTVSVALATNPTGRTDLAALGGLTGTLVEAADDGVARFADLRIGLPGSGWVIEATADGLQSALSEEITVRLTFADVAAGYSHACGITTAGFAYCWGRGASGRLGDGASVDRTFPTPVASARRFLDLTIGRDHTCGRAASSADTYCWGSNFTGQLGTGGPQGAEPEPTAVVGGHAFDRVIAGSFFTCGVTAQSEAYCWGSNQDGTLGDGTSDSWSTAPRRVAGQLRFREVSGGNGHACGVTSASDAYCWGGVNQYGALGDGTTTPRTLPTAVVGGISFANVSAGGAFSCGLDNGGSAWCWGYNEDGRVGDGTFVSRDAPVPVAGGMQFTSLESRVIHTCALTSAGTAWCWGRNTFGNLGDGTTANRNQPTPVAGGLSFARLSVGTHLTCGVTADGQAYCWGRNDFGQVGDGTTENRLTPTRVVH